MKKLVKLVSNIKEDLDTINNSLLETKGMQGDTILFENDDESRFEAIFKGTCQ